MINQTASSPVATAFGRAIANRLGRRIKVLIVDDSVVIRRIIAQSLSSDSELEVVGSAANGRVALQMASNLKPDVITLDIEMPEMDGLTTLRNLRASGSSACVIMFSTLTTRGASAAIDALMLGANDYVTKPSNTGPMDLALTKLHEEMVPKIKQFFTLKTAAPITARSLPATPPKLTMGIRPSVPLFTLAAERKVVAIGVSTGGPTALMEILPQLPASFSLPIVIVQHMPPLFTKLLAERLAATCKFAVAEATDGMKLEAGRVLIAPGDYHMQLHREGKQVMVRLDQGPRENSCRPAVDVLFRSVAEVYAGGAIAVVLTGMGQDGLHGVEMLKSKGAYVIAQDQRSSVVWGMPGAVVEAGLADSVPALHGVVPEILWQVSR
jgi:two-component system, chemotaxis family, protein-glutamate methylesterase/glutaminase